MMKSIRIFTIFSIIIIVSLFVSKAVLADHNQHVFEQANELYQQEKFEDAIVKYLEIINNGYESWQLYFNIGNTYYRTGQFGKAILYFERAYRLNPKNEDIVFNLNLANTKVVDNIKTPPLSELLDEVKNVLSKSALMWLTIGTYLGLMAVITMKMFVTKRKFQRLLRIILIPIFYCIITGNINFNY